MAYEHLCAALVREVRSARAREGDATSSDSIASDDDDAAVEDDLERVGARVGHGLAHLACARADPTHDDQGAMTLLCKEFWQATHAKRADALRTNNRGTFVVHDDAFAPMRCVTARESSTGADAREIGRDARALLAFHAGHVRGAAAALGARVAARGEFRDATAVGVDRRRPRRALGRLDAPAVAFVVDAGGVEAAASVAS